MSLRKSGVPRPAEEDEGGMGRSRVVRGFREKRVFTCHRIPAFGGTASGGSEIFSHKMIMKANEKKKDVEAYLNP